MSRCPKCKKAVQFDTYNGVRRPLHKCEGQYSTIESYTYPTPCPKCQQNVFYYQNEAGGKVFFDQLGPPWPKHICHTMELSNNFENGVYYPAKMLTFGNKALRIEVTFLGFRSERPLEFWITEEESDYLLKSVIDESPIVIEVKEGEEGTTLYLHSFIHREKLVPICINQKMKKSDFQQYLHKLKSPRKKKKKKKAFARLNY